MEEFKLVTKNGGDLVVIENEYCANWHMTTDAMRVPIRHGVQHHFQAAPRIIKRGVFKN